MCLEYFNIKEIHVYLHPASPRTICLCQLVTACFGVWVVEQPGSSVLDYYPAWLHFLARQYQVFGTCAVTAPESNLCHFQCAAPIPGKLATT